MSTHIKTTPFTPAKTYLFSTSIRTCHIQALKMKWNETTKPYDQFPHRFRWIQLFMRCKYVKYHSNYSLVFQWKFMVLQFTYFQHKMHETLSKSLHFLPLLEKKQIQNLLKQCMYPIRLTLFSSIHWILLWVTNIIILKEPILKVNAKYA